jgi:thiol:disulfide interchange protein DsbC
MSRITINLSTLLLASLLSGGSVLAADDSNLDTVRAKMNSMFDEIKAEDVNESPVDGWFTVQKGSIVAYVSADGRYLLQGDLIDLDMSVNLSEVARTDGRRKLMSSVTDDQIILFSPADPKYRVTVFTDVDCGYCRKLHSEINEYLAAGIAVRYVMYPRNGPAAPSWNTAEDVWCAKDRNQALTAAKLDREFATQKCDASIISKNYLLGQNVGLSGTPAIVFEDGTLVSGYLPPADLASRLRVTQQSAAN